MTSPNETRSRIDDTQEESKDGSKKDVSFNTLLNDSSLSFNPDGDSSSSL